jgi:hypothetical protein
LRLCACGCRNAIVETKRNKNTKYIRGHSSRDRIVKRKYESIDEKFWLNVDKKSDNECWEWTGPIQPNGYGQINYNYKKKYVHRVSYEIHFGKIYDNLLVCHSCDNRKCVNPKHLFLGTHLDNSHDMVSKGRAVNPTKWAAKITFKDAENIRELNSIGFHVDFLSTRYELTRSTIRNIIAERIWKKNIERQLQKY